MHGRASNTGLSQPKARRSAAISAHIRPQEPCHDASRQPPTHATDADHHPDTNGTYLRQKASLFVIPAALNSRMAGQAGIQWSGPLQFAKDAGSWLDQLRC